MADILRSLRLWPLRDLADALREVLPQDAHHDILFRDIILGKWNTTYRGVDIATMERVHDVLYNSRHGLPPRAIRFVEMVVSHRGSGDVDARLAGVGLDACLTRGRMASIMLRQAQTAAVSSPLALRRLYDRWYECMEIIAQIRQVAPAAPPDASGSIIEVDDLMVVLQNMRDVLNVLSKWVTKSDGKK